MIKLVSWGWWFYFWLSSRGAEIRIPWKEKCEFWKVRRIAPPQPCAFLSLLLFLSPAKWPRTAGRHEWHVGIKKQHAIIWPSLQETSSTFFSVPRSLLFFMSTEVEYVLAISVSHGRYSSLSPGTKTTVWTCTWIQIFKLYANHLVKGDSSFSCTPIKFSCTS